MRLHISILAVAIALAAGCDRGAEPAKPSTQSGPPPSQSSAPSQPQANTPTTPANAGATSSRVEKNPTQGQVDPKQAEQHRDFEQKGDAAGPKNPQSPKGGS